MRTVVRPLSNISGSGLPFSHPEDLVQLHEGFFVFSMQNLSMPFLVGTFSLLAPDQSVQRKRYS